MRQIKFRGRRLEDGEWVYGDLVENQGRFFIYHATSENTLKDNNIVICAIEVKFDTVGQFTGLYDKNGKEIYEGDIVNIHDSHETCGVIEYRDYTAAFVLCREKARNKHKGDGTDYQLYSGRQEKYEIIGNIHDNPELLKESPAPQKTQEEEIQIGDVIEVDGAKYIAVEASEHQDCNCCDLMDFSNCLGLLGHCSSDWRKDGKDLLLKKIGGEK